MYQMLDQGIRQKYGRLIQSWQQGYLPLLTEETVDTVVSLDGSTISSIIVRFMPFDIATVSETAWNTRQTQSDENCRRTVRQFVAEYLLEDSIDHWIALRISCTRKTRTSSL